MQRDSMMNIFDPTAVSLVARNILGHVLLSAQRSVDDQMAYWEKRNDGVCPGPIVAREIRDWLNTHIVVFGLAPIEFPAIGYDFRLPLDFGARIGFKAPTRCTQSVLTTNGPTYFMETCNDEISHL